MMTVSRRELAYRAIERLLAASAYFQKTGRNTEFLLEACANLPIAILQDGGELAQNVSAGLQHCEADVTIDVGVACSERDQVPAELSRARAEAFNALARWVDLPEAGTLLANVTYVGCSAPELAAKGEARGVMTLIYTMTYVQAELDALAA